MKTLLVGMGNPILSDDAVGVRLARGLAPLLGDGLPGLTALHDGEPRGGDRARRVLGSSSRDDRRARSDRVRGRHRDVSPDAKVWATT